MIYTLCVYIGKKGKKNYYWMGNNKLIYLRVFGSIICKSLLFHRLLVK